MSERAVGALLVSLRRVATLHRLYGSGHPLTTVALEEAAASAAALSPSRPVQLTVVDESVYLDRTLLPVASLAHNGFLRVMRERGVVSLTLVPPVQSPDLARLTAVLAGESHDFPETGRSASTRTTSLRRTWPAPRGKGGPTPPHSTCCGR